MCWRIATIKGRYYWQVNRLAIESRWVAIFPHLNFKKCSEPDVFYIFWLQNVLVATPISPGCTLCMAAGKRLEPSLEFAEFCDKCDNPPNADYPQEANRARQAILEELEANESRTLPVFVPGAQVAQQSTYGHMIYTKAALVTDSELLSFTGKTAAGLGLSAWAAENAGPSSNNNFYVVSLQDFPGDKDCVRKIKFCHSSSAIRDTLGLLA